jgi:TetR/AcrR family transcriptional regulator
LVVYWLSLMTLAHFASAFLQIFIIINLIMTNTPAIRTRPRGRPTGARNTQRGRLLAAAQQLLARRLPQDLSLREVARQAGVTPALAHYYFGNRDGLIDVLMRERLAPHIEDLVAAARVRAGQPQLALTFLMQRMCSLLASDPLLRRCLWLPHATALKLREQLRACLRELLVRAQNMRALREDLSPEYLADSLLGLVLFPFLDDESNTDASSERVAQLTLQHVALLRDGIVNAPRARRGTTTGVS